MALAFENQIEIIEVMEGFLINSRPPEEIRDQLDLNYRIENQCVIVFEIRPKWNNPTEKIECKIAKATYIQKDTTWAVFWFMSDMKWHGYKPNLKVKSLKEFIKVINEDKHGCFWG
ncbi:DUF3024 domain-containing protein [Flavobacterium luteum]|uniref:DUF3024 domain-containing protein n=1 Tax=Flavobacterium luteum TaxID=2026654 RepID=A0A7J5AJT6_9FLAO|nr:DUF3024 domain-containing protein [Flavobacterium luteum]KAB1157678.1 DUF3024 domain-containing protein [Flavobacterium luteum]